MCLAYIREAATKSYFLSGPASKAGQYEKEIERFKKGDGGGDKNRRILLCHLLFYVSKKTWPYFSYIR